MTSLMEIILWNANPNPDCSKKHFEIKILHFLKQKSDQRKLFLFYWKCFFYEKSCRGKQEIVPIKKAPVSQSFLFILLCFLRQV